MKTTNSDKDKIYLGIDPGTVVIGYGVVQEKAGSFSCLDYGTIENSSKNHSDKLISAYAALQSLLREHKPCAIGIEKLFFFKNHKTVIPVSEMRGVLLLALRQSGALVHEFTPLQVKQTICNYGLADKKQVQRMIQKLLKIRLVIKPDDAADALALAVCCGTLASHKQRG